MSKFRRFHVAALALLGAGLIPGPALADIVHGDNTIINNSIAGSGSLCVGAACVDGEAFQNHDQIRLKSINVGIDFDDTSPVAPTNDWRIIINDILSSGADYFAIEDSTTLRQVFRVDAGAPANALRVLSDGNVGFGTATPAANPEIPTRNCPGKPSMI